MENKINNPELVGQMIPTLARSLSNHKSTTSIVPDLINMLFEKYPDGTIKYKHFIIPHTGEEIRYDTLDDFLEAKTPIGLQCSREDLRKWAEYVPDRIKAVVKDELYEEMAPSSTNQYGKSAVDNINNKKSYMKGSTSEAYIISRLKRDNPEMAQKVLSGELSANKAAIKIGIRKKYIQVQATIPAIAAKVKKMFSPDQLQELVTLINQGNNE